MPWRTIVKWTAIVVGACALVLLVFGSAILEYFVERGVAPYLGDKPAYTHEAGRTLDFRIEMDDGIELQTEVFLPEGEGPWPTVLVRDAYGLQAGMISSFKARLNALRSCQLERRALYSSSPASMLDRPVI